MRILQLTQFYPPISGGVEVHVAALAEGLAARGHEVAVATLDRGTEGGAEESDTVPVHILQGTAQRVGALHSTERRHATPLPDPEVMLALRRLVREFQPDIVHAHNWLGRSFLPLKAGSHARYVLTLHDCGSACAQGRMMLGGKEYCVGPEAGHCLQCSMSYYGAVKGVLTLLGNRAMRTAELDSVDLFLPVSSAVAGANRLPSRAPVEIVPNFVAEPENRFTEPRPELAALPPEPFILQVGDVVADKGVHVLFEAYRRLLTPPPLVLIGRIDERMRRSLPEGAVALGVWPHDLVLEAWRRCLFGTMPSLCLDACPTVTLEAMATERAVVASARGGLADQVIEGVTGLLVTPGDVEDLRRAMARLIGNVELRRLMGKIARRRFEQEYRSDVVIERIERLYRRLILSAVSGARTSRDGRRPVQRLDGPPGFREDGGYCPR